jgi:transposase
MKSITGKAGFGDDFKRVAGLQITERGYPVMKVSRWLGVSPHSLHAWKKKFSRPSDAGNCDIASSFSPPLTLF